MYRNYLCRYRFGWARKGWSAPGANDATTTGTIKTAEEALALWSAEAKTEEKV